MAPSLKRVGKRWLAHLGYAIRRLHSPATIHRPIGELGSVLEDFKARGFNPALIFDCGASDGSWTRLVQPIFPDARFVTIEPRIGTGLQPTVQAAVGANAGTATLTDWDTGSTLLSVDPAGSPQSPVPVTTLDALAAQFGMPDFVKLDIEGFELEALRGASSLFGRTELFMIEVSTYRFHDRPMLHDVIAFMAERDYYVYDIAGFIRRPYDGAIGLMDLCFARRLRGSETAWHRE